MSEEIDPRPGVRTYAMIALFGIACLLALCGAAELVLYRACGETPCLVLSIAAFAATALLIGAVARFAWRIDGVRRLRDHIREWGFGERLRR